MKIVIVEDEIRIREGLERLIGKLNPAYEVVGLADNGQAGCRLVKQTAPDVIITDIRMPEMDGLEMLSLLFQEGCRAQAIVLSAYSEFEYARTAMRMGVKEYLLKPLVMNDVSEALQRVEKELELQRQQPEEMFGSAEQILAGILLGSLPADALVEEQLWQRFDIPTGSSYQGIFFYLGRKYEEKKKNARRELELLLAQREDMKYVLLEAERECGLMILIYQVEDVQKLERWVQYWLLQDQSRQVRGAVGFITNLGLSGLRDGFDTLMRHMEWNISLGDEVMISYPKITKLQTSPCIFPLELERRMKQAVCTGQTEKVKKSLEDFYRSFRNGEIYEPRQVKECCVRFFWSFINTGKEVGLLEQEGLEQQKLLEQVMGARTSEELQAVSDYLINRLRTEKYQEGERESSYLMIKKAQSLIHEFYQTGITLEEIAARLNLTPEYLGTRFHQELGVTFSAYIKELRIRKAKELLIGTSLKLYEIAARVGYTDPKYFSRVFREATGLLPADYRKTHK